jgi:hypothetical protein
MPPSSEYDVFISYARDEIEWVMEKVYSPLCRCTTRRGDRPRIFFDKSRKGGIGAGQNWGEAIMRALAGSRRIVAVYSKRYFERRMCRWELGKAWERDPVGDRGILNPILRQDDVTVPDQFTQIQHVSCESEKDWFERLCDSLDLIPAREGVSLEFLDQPVDTPVNHTLPPVRVALGKGGTRTAEETISLNAEGVALQGTLTATTREGVATFEDLSVGVPAESTRLVAVAEGLEPALSTTFRVLVQTEPPPRETSLPQVSARGEALFFGDGQTLAVVSPDRIAVYDLAGTPLGPGLELRGRLCLARRKGPLIAFADWAGNVYLIASDGRCATWSFGNPDGGFVVPGDVAIAADGIFVGFWSGQIFRISLTESPVLQLHHTGGVQAMVAGGDRFFVCDFAGALSVYRSGRLVNTAALEPCVWILKAYAKNLMAVGETRLFHIPLDTLKVLDETPPMSGIAAVHDLTAIPVVIDPEGKGGRYDDELILRGSFHTVAGAVPVSADEHGCYTTFLNPDGSRTLLARKGSKRDRIVFSHPDGTLAIAPAGDRFALGEAGGIRILDADGLAARMMDG